MASDGNNQKLKYHLLDPTAKKALSFLIPPNNPTLGNQWEYDPPEENLLVSGVQPGVQNREEVLIPTRQSEVPVSIQQRDAHRFGLDISSHTEQSKPAASVRPPIKAAAKAAANSSAKLSKNAPERPRRH